MDLADDIHRSYEAGKREFERYSELVDGNDEAHVPFVRASSASRCVDSATNWTSGTQILYPISNEVP